MSNFKKLRLDPETPVQGGPHRNLSNQPGGAIDGSGRSYMDSSSFSSSTSGGSGPYSNMRSAGPFRTRYSQPLRIPSPNTSSFSRFAPYYFGKERRTTLKIPLIRARRDESESDGYRPSSRASLNSSLGGDSTSSATTSTAQRIIETLQNLSTPVMNAGKIRIDQDIKAVQPLSFGHGSPLSRYSPGSSMNRSSGPPKMSSSLLLSTPSSANQISPSSNAADQRRLFYIPRMIDAATNTDRDTGAGAASPSQLYKSNKEAAELRTMTPTTPSKPMFGGPVSKSTATSKDDNSDEEYHECNSNFTFSSPWSPQVFDRYFSNDKEDKSVEKGQQQPHNMLNGFKETTIPSTSGTGSMFPVSNKNNFTLASNPLPTSAADTLPKSSIAPSGGNNFSFGGTGGASSTFSFASPMKSTSLTSPLKQTEPLRASDSKQSSSGPQESSLIGTKNTPEPALPTAPGSFKFGNTDGSAPLKTTFSFGKDNSKDDKPATTTSFDKVDAGTNSSLISTKSPLSTSSTTSTNTTTLPPLTAKSSGSKWRCSTCMVENELTAQTCVCCSEKNPNQTSVKPASIPASKKWRCPTCMVENDLGAAACVCCSEKNPNPSPAAKKWRCPTCMVENDTTASACVCCSEKNPNYTEGKKDEGPSSAPTPTFKFGVASSAGTGTAPSGNSTFSFGQTTSAAAPKTTFSFGAPPATSTITSVPPSAPLVPSNASSLTPTEPSVPQVTTSASPFTANLQPATTSSPSFKFGSGITPATTLPSSAPSFGFPPATSAPANTTNTSSVPAPVFGMTKPINSEAPGSTPLSAPAASSVFGSTAFQSPGSQPSIGAGTGFNFGKTAATATDPQKTTGFAFGGSAGAKPSFGSSFQFGNSSQTPGTQPTVPTSVLPSNPQGSSLAPGIGGTPNFSFGSNNPSAPSPFGQIQSPPSNASPFQFGGAATPNRMNPSPAPAPTPAFSLAPNMNFGATPGSTLPFGNPAQPTPNAGSQPPPSLFTFNANPTESPGQVRKFKKAVRRNNK